MKDEFVDDDLGIVYITRNPKARRLIARRKENGIYLTVPLLCSLVEIKSMFDKIKPRLLDLKPITSLFFDESTQLKTLTFTVNIRREDVRNYYVRLVDKTLNIVCPFDTDFSFETTQHKIRNYIENTLRNEAKRIVPEKLKMYAEKHSFVFSDVKINKSRSRWGSCSSKKSINISWFCMFLPEHLLDFIILHELCHTIEMNHGERFWDLLDKITSGCSKELTQELKNVKLIW